MVDLSNIYNRTEMLIGKDNLNILNNANILILGIGGVGSYVLESLARVGIGNITIVDKDVIDVTNINRQIIATTSSVGLNKVDVAKDRVYDINSNIKLKTLKEKISVDNIDKIISNEFNYVIDCIDDFKAKIEVIKYCYDNDIKIISCMGMANKLNPLDIRVDDINKTTQCKLAKKVRKELKSLNVSKLKVVYSVENTRELLVDNDESILGSVSFVPSTAGLVIASEVIKDIIKI